MSVNLVTAMLFVGPPRASHSVVISSMVGVWKKINDVRWGKMKPETAWLGRESGADVWVEKDADILSQKLQTENEMDGGDAEMRLQRHVVRCGGKR